MTFASAHPPRDSSAGGLRRLELIDALRGFALCGVLMVNLRLVPLFDARTLLLVLLCGTGTVGTLRGLRVLHVLRESVAHRRFWRWLLVASLGVAALLAWRNEGAGLLQLQAASLAQGLFCIAAFVLLFQRTAWRRRLRKLSPMGRMVLTNCVAQTLVVAWLFPRLGLGVEGVMGAAMLGTGLLALQAAASCWWMTRSRQGPLEWAWQRLSQGLAQALPRPAPVVTEAPIVDVPRGSLCSPLRE